MTPRRTIPILCVGALSLLLTNFSAAWATAPDSSTDSQLGHLENRYFFHPYANDPVEKRLERLELLIYGATQDGTNEERFARLKQTVKERDAASAAKARAAAPSAPGASKSATPPPASSSQYPILNTLEWRALKKTYPQDSLDARLGRIETKLFGQPSPAMAYADRVDRLNRTLGVGAEAAKPTGPTMRIGPMPKAMPRGQQEFGWAPSNPGPDMPIMPMPIPMPGFGGGGGGAMGPFDLSNRFGEIFRQMDQQMEQMMRMAPNGSGVFEYEFRSDGVHPPTIKKRTIPGPGGSPRVTPMIPMPQEQPDYKPKIPPYYDPNSI